jgi:phospholipase/carboxylesterase
MQQDRPSTPQRRWRMSSRQVSIESGRLTLPSPRSESCALLGPIHYEAQYAYPLLVWLHGSGGSEAQLQRVMPHLSLRNYVAVAPRGVLPLGDSRQQGYTWAVDPAGLLAADRAVQKAIAVAQARYHIAPHRVFLAGFGVGGTVAVALAARWPRQFAGGVSLCGPLGHVPIPSGPAGPHEVALLLTCGEDGRQCTPGELYDVANRLENAGYRVATGVYACRDELTLEMLADVNRWIMQRVAQG